MIIGDSQVDTMPVPSMAINAIQTWLQTCFGRRYELKGPTMKCQSQIDMSSCGLFTVNMIEHAVLGDDLCQQINMAMYRAHWFNTLVDQLVGNRVTQREDLY